MLCCNGFNRVFCPVVFFKWAATHQSTLSILQWITEEAYFLCSSLYCLFVEESISISLLYDPVDEVYFFMWFCQGLEQQRRVLEESVYSLRSENQDLKTDMDSLTNFIQQARHQHTLVVSHNIRLSLSPSCLLPCLSLNLCPSTLTPSI